MTDTDITSHPVADVPLTIAYPTVGPFGGNAVIHATGCAHTAREVVGGRARNSVYRAARDMGTWRPDGDTYPDDYYGVAPCARKKAKA